MMPLDHQNGSPLGCSVASPRAMPAVEEPVVLPEHAEVGDSDSRSPGRAFFEDRILPHGLLVVLLAFVVLIGNQFITKKPMWLDEILTEDYCRADSFQELWRRLCTGTQSDPPGYYVLARLSIACFGLSPWSMRLPALLGMLLYIVSVYVFLARRYPVVYARLGAVLCIMPPALDFLCDARPYALWLAFTALGLVCWQSATVAGGRWRWLGLAGLAVCTALAVSMHFYAVLGVAAFGGAELFRSFQRRRIDLCVWVALIAGICPLLLYRPIMANARSFIANSGFSPKTYSIALTYMKLLDPLLPVILTLIVGVALSRRTRTSASAAGAGVGMPMHELAAVVLLVVLPVVGFVLAAVITNNYHTRYVLPTVIGIAVLLTVAIANASGPRQRLGSVSLGVAFLCLLLSFAWFASNRLSTPADCTKTWPIAVEAEKLAALEKCSVVTDNTILFVPLRYHRGESARSFTLVCATGTQEDEVGRRLRDRYEPILEPDDLRGLKRCLLVPELNHTKRLEAHLSRLGARILRAVRFQSGGTAFLLELPDPEKPSR